MRSLAGAALWALSACLPSGCLDGGTSTEAGNPSVTLGFEGPRGKVPLRGELRLYARDASPVFFYPFPSDGASPPWVQVGGGDLGPASWLLSGKSVVTLRRNDLDGLINPRPEFALAKSSARAGSQDNLAVTGAFPDFNVVVFGEDGSVGTLLDVVLDSSGGGFHLQGRGPADTLWIEIDSARGLVGTVDTAGLSAPPLAIYVPGTPFYAQFHGDGFALSGLPRQALPLRLVTADGYVYAVSGADSLTRDMGVTLRAGARVDSIALPPVLAAPLAVPAGPRSFTDSLYVSLMAQTGSEIRYTLNGSTPTADDPVYTKPILLRSSTTIKAAAFRNGYKTSPLSSNNYLLVPTQPLAAPAGRNFHDSLTVTLSDTAAGARILYTLNGADPVASDSLYTGAIKLKTTTTIRAVAFVSGLGYSQITQETYVLVPDSTALGL